MGSIYSHKRANTLVSRLSPERIGSLERGTRLGRQDGEAGHASLFLGKASGHSVEVCVGRVLRCRGPYRDERIPRDTPVPTEFSVASGNVALQHITSGKALGLDGLERFGSVFF